MYHLKLIKALSYTGAVTATREKPDVFTEDETVAMYAISSGYFELVEATEANTDAPGEENTEEANHEEPGEDTPGEGAPGEENENEVTDAFSETSEDAPEPAVAPDFETLAAMTKQELIAYANERKIDLDKCKTKEDILGAISVFYGGSYTMIDLQHE